MRIPACITLCLLGSLLGSSSALFPQPAGDQYTLSLNGEWRFKLESAGTETRLGSEGDNDARAAADRAKAKQTVSTVGASPARSVEPFQNLDYQEDKSWVSLKVPGNWEMAGLSPATYNQPDNASGYYRLWFQVPKSWEGRLVRLNFD